MDADPNPQKKPTPEATDQEINRLEAALTNAKTQVQAWHKEALRIDGALIQMRSLRDLALGKPVHLEGLAHDGQIHVDEDHVM